MQHKAKTHTYLGECEELKRIVDSYSEQLQSLKEELTNKQCGWHNARDDPSWATDNKGIKLDAMRSEIKVAMSRFAQAITKEITGQSGQFKDFGTQGYKSDIDLTYIPDNNNREFSYASGKLVFDAVFASSFDRLPEDLFDLEVYVQHPGKSMHTGEELKTKDGKTCFVQAELQAAFLKVETGPTAQNLLNAICKDGKETVKAGIKAIMSDVEMFHIVMNDLKESVLENTKVDTTEKGGIFSESAKKRGFAEASFRDTLIYTIYQDHIQDFQNQIQSLQKEIDIPDRASEQSFAPSRSGSIQKTHTFSKSAFNQIYVEPEFERSNSGMSLEQKDPKLLIGDEPIQHQSESVNFSPTPKSPEQHSGKLQPQKSRFSPNFEKNDSHNFSQANEDWDVSSRANSFTKSSRLSPLASIKQESLTPVLGSLAKISLKRSTTGFDTNRPETPVSEHQSNLRSQMDNLRVKQARFATYTESLTKEGFNSQGALRDIVENRDGQEDTKYAKQINGKIFELELQDKPFSSSIRELLNNDEGLETLIKKVSQPKLPSSFASLLASAVENFHFYTKHLNESLEIGNRETSNNESPLDLNTRLADLENDISKRAADAAIKESKYELRFATRALDVYEKLVSDEKGDFTAEREILEEILEHAEDLEKMKRQEQIPLSAFLEKLSRDVPLLSSSDQSKTFDFPSALNGLSQFEPLRLKDLIQDSIQGEIPKLNPNIMTSVSFYKDVIARLSDAKGPFETKALNVGSIQLPVLALSSNVPTTAENIKKVQELNTWVMALSGFPSNLYALPLLKEAEIAGLKNKRIETIAASLSTKSQECKKMIFEEAQFDILEKSNLQTYSGVKSFSETITSIYGNLIKTAVEQMNLFKDRESYQDDNSLSKPFLSISKNLLEKQNFGGQNAYQ